MKQETLLKLAGGVAGALLIAFGARLWLWERSHETTDDAFIDAHVATISPQISGQAVKIDVDDNQLVKKGDPLVEIDPSDYALRLSQAKDALASALADARKAQEDADSSRELFARDRVSRQQFQHALAEEEVRRAQARVAQDKVAAAELDLSRTRIVAPEDGRVTKRAVEIRTMVQPGQPLMAIVPARVWVTANFKETQLTRMRPGQRALVHVDAYPRRALRAHVDSIQSGTGGRFSLLPPENATGNFVKVVQRVPVKIVFDEDPKDLTRLSPGMSVEPEVEVR